MISRNICGISLEKKRAFFSFGCIKKNRLHFLGEEEIVLAGEGGLIELLKANAEAIGKAIVAAERKYVFRTNKVFFELPSGLFLEKEVSEGVVLPKKKKINASDIDFAKKYLENKFLEWDERCVHNIILSYKVEGRIFSQAPLGFLASKIALNSTLIYVKDKFYREIESIFSNLEKNFSGFIVKKISILSQCFDFPEKNQIAVAIGDSCTFVSAKLKNGKIIERKFAFGIKAIIQYLAKQYLVSEGLAFDLLQRYGTFKTIPYHKEAAIKKENGYLNVSTQALGNFLKKSFLKNLEEISEEIFKKNNIEKQEAFFSFTGPLSLKEGFFGYLKNSFAGKVKMPLYRSKSSSPGCMHYASFMPLEKNHRNKLSFIEKIKRIYSEYF